MEAKIKRLITPLAFLAVLLFCGFCLYKKPTSLEDVLSYCSYATTILGLLFFIYYKWLWRIIPWNRNPVLKKNYTASIYYFENNVQKTKEMQVKVKQTWLSIRVETGTDINSSRSITSSIVEENGAKVLYYTYLTDPKALVQKKNPIQHGTCRMVLNDKNEYIRGKYWTSSKTIGDIEWKAIGKKTKKE